MRKLATSALGVLMLNPIGCSGTPQVDTGTGGAATGGYTGVVHCNPSQPTTCGVGRICKQTMFPIMPPVGYDGGFSDISYLYECVPAGTGGNSGTGGNPSTGGNPGTGGTRSTSIKAPLVGGSSAAQSVNEAKQNSENDAWWKTAEAALRHT
jgi:hypothetical protein